MFIKSSYWNWHPLLLSCFLSPFVTSHGSLIRAHSPPYLWRIWMKFRDALNFFVGMVFVIMSTRFFFVLIFIKLIALLSTTHWRILWYLTSIRFVHLWYMWSLVRWIVLWLSNELELNHILYQKSRPILTTTKFFLMPQLQLCTLSLSLKEQQYLATLPSK